MLIAVASRSFGTESAMTDGAAGPAVASPMPTAMRIRNSLPKERVSPDAAVAIVHSRKPTEIRPTRWTRSTRIPNGMPITA